MRQDITLFRPSPPHYTSQELVDHLVQACEEQDILYVVFWLRKMKDKGLLWAVGGREGVDAPRECSLLVKGKSRRSAHRSHLLPPCPSASL